MQLVWRLESAETLNRPKVGALIDAAEAQAKTPFARRAEGSHRPIDFGGGLKFILDARHLNRLAPRH
jgi:hypothetical protein